MSITAGVFSETQLVHLQGKADQLWSDRAQKEDYVAQVEVVKAIQAQQTATIGTQLRGKKIDQLIDQALASDRSHHPDQDDQD